MRVTQFYFLVLVALIASPSGAVAKALGPAGIYVISNTRDDKREPKKFDLDYVAGVTLRMHWKSIESLDPRTGSVVYDFSRIDRFIKELTAAGQSMTLEIFASSAPDYLLKSPGTATWLNPRFKELQVVPWDKNALVAYYKMMTALSNHVVPSTGIRLADHPTLVTVDAPIVGLAGVREQSGALVKHPDYSRKLFVESIRLAVLISRQAFPQKYGFLAFFRMDDGNRSNPLDKEIFEMLQSNFNGRGQLSLGYFQETLSDIGPRKTTQLGYFLNKASSNTYVMFQALKPWVIGDREVASGTPITGMENAWNDFRSVYVELYGGDVLNQDNAAQLKEWAQFYRTVGNSRGAQPPTSNTRKDSTNSQSNSRKNPTGDHFNSRKNPMSSPPNYRFQ